MTSQMHDHCHQDGQEVSKWPVPHPYNIELRKKALLHLLNYASCEGDGIPFCFYETIEQLQEDIGYPLDVVDAIALFQEMHSTFGFPDYETYCTDAPGNFESPETTLTRLEIQGRHPPLLNEQGNHEQEP